MQRGGEGLENDPGMPRQNEAQATSFYTSADEQQVKQVKNWLKFWKAHKHIPARNFYITDPNQESTAYRLSILNVEGLVGKRPEKDTQKFGIRFYANTYSKKAKNFFGRTFEGPVIECILDDKLNTLKMKDSETLNLYYHTRVTQDAQAIITLEFKFLELKSLDVLLSERQLGWLELPMTMETGDQNNRATTIQLKRGSPREMISNPEGTNSGKGEGGIQLMLTRYAPFEIPKYIIDESVLVGSNEEVPGIIDVQKRAYLPAGLEDKQIEVERQPPVKVLSIEFRMPREVEQKLIQRVRDQAGGGQGRTNNPIVEIKERKFVAAFHNGWTCINKKGFQNSQGLNYRTQQTNEGEHVVLEYNNEFTIERISAHEKCVLLLQLEYQFNVNGILQVKPLGWLPYPIAAILGQTVIIEDELIKGSGKTVEGVKLLDSGGDYRITVKAQIDVTGAKRKNVDVAAGGFNPFESIGGGAGAGAGPAAPDPAKERELLQLREKTRQLEEALLNQQRQNAASAHGLAAPVQFQSTMPSEDSKQILETIRSFAQREEHYLRMIEELKREQLGMQDTYHRQIEEVRTHLIDLKERGVPVAAASQQSFYQPPPFTQTQPLPNMQSQSPFMQQGLPNVQQQVYAQTTGQGFYGPRATQGEAVAHEELERLRAIEAIVAASKIDRGTSSDKAFLVQSPYGVKELTQKELLFLRSQGVIGILDDSNKDAQSSMLEERDLEKDINDPLKASKIKVQFLGLQINTALLAGGSGTENAQRRPTEAAGVIAQNFYIPEKVYFTMTFFDYPLFATDTVTYSEAGDARAVQTAVQEERTFVLVREKYLAKLTDQKEPVYIFDVDPSKSRYKNLHRDFIYYLNRKSLHIDVWDAENLMLYGTVKIPLRALRRAGRKEQSKVYKADILEPHFSRVKGYLQISLANFGYPCEVMAPEVAQTSTGFAGTASDVRNWNTVSDASKRRVKSTAPLQLPGTFQSNLRTEGTEGGAGEDGASAIYADLEERKRVRIKRFKLAQMQRAVESGGAGAGVDSAENLAALGSTLEKNMDIKRRIVQEISNYREEKKPNFVKEVLSQFLSKEKLCPVFFGKVEIVPFEFANNGNAPMTYRVRIEDPDVKFLEKPELTLISNAEEWKFFAEQVQTPLPHDRELIASDTFTLDAGVQITLLFKFLSYREVDASLTQHPELAQHKDEAYRKRFILNRSINVYLEDTQKDSFEGFKLRIEPHPQIVDHLFRYYERENRTISLVLPSLYNESVPPKERPTLKITYPAAVIEWGHDFREARIRLKVPSAASIERFNLLAYKDPYLFELLGNWQIEVHSLSGLDVSVVMGQRTPGHLTVYGDISRTTVSLYSSHPQLVSFPSPYDRPFALIGGMHTPVPIRVLSFSQQPQKVQVNCVDVTTKQLIHSWIIRIDPETPTVQKMYDIQCEVGHKSVQRFYYQNRDTNANFFTFMSSNPDVLALEQSQIPIDGGKREQVRIIIQPRQQEGSSDIFVFVSDQDEKIFECLFFKVTFSQRKL